MGQWHTKQKDDSTMHTPTHQAFKLPPDFDPRSPTSEYNRTPILVDDVKKKKTEERMHRKVLKKMNTPVEQAEDQKEVTKFGDSSDELNSGDMNVYKRAHKHVEQDVNSSATNLLDMSSDEPVTSPSASTTTECEVSSETKENNMHG